MTTHTQGPWKLNETWMLIEGPKGEEIAAVHPAQGPNEKRATKGIANANARLIAAAPELLEALKALNGTLINYLNAEIAYNDEPCTATQDRFDIQLYNLHKAGEEAQAAIARAEQGDTP